MNLAKMTAANEAYRNANPWTILNDANHGAMYQRFATRAAAEAFAARYPGGVVRVNVAHRVVVIECQPCL